MIRAGEIAITTRRITTAGLTALLSVAILHGFVTLGMLADLRGHWGWYGSLVLTVGTIVYIGTILESRHAADTAAAAAARRASLARDLPAKYR